MERSVEIEDGTIDLVVVDPPYNAKKGFPNDGTTVIVSKKLGRVGIGIEMVDAYHDKGVDILQKTYRGQKLKNTLWKRDAKDHVTRLDRFL